MLDTPPDRRASSDHDQPFDRSRGMHFLCLNADIEQQFEFVQQRWINDPTFVNQRTDEVDPILGRQRDNPTFRVPANPTPVVLGEGTVPLKRFTHIIGGEYFFLPSQRALKYLAATATARG
jgi:deferrochelatase/peroxidase EfeB